MKVARIDTAFIRRMMSLVAISVDPAWPSTQNMTEEEWTAARAKYQKEVWDPTRAELTKYNMSDDAGILEFYETCLKQLLDAHEQFTQTDALLCRAIAATNDNETMPPGWVTLSRDLANRLDMMLPPQSPSTIPPKARR